MSGLSCFYRLQLEAEISMSSGLVRDFIATSPFRLNVLIILIFYYYYFQILQSGKCIKENTEIL